MVNWKEVTEYVWCSSAQRPITTVNVVFFNIAHDPCFQGSNILRRAHKSSAIQIEVSRFAIGLQKVYNVPSPAVLQHCPQFYVVYSEPTVSTLFKQHYIARLP